MLDNGVAAACAEHNIPLVAYSPVCRGLLTGKFKSIEDIPEGSRLRMFPRFQPDAFPINLELFKQVEALAKKKGCTSAQLAINWTIALSKKPGMPTIIPIPGATVTARVDENGKQLEITDAEMAEIDSTLKKFEVVGARYPPFIPTEG